MQLGIYRHYKGGYYLVTGVAIHTESQEELVIYIPLYEDKDHNLFDESKGYKQYARPRKMFEDTVNVVDEENKPTTGSMYSASYKNIQRFQFIRDKL